MRLEYEVVDVFTDRAFAGNPLAVVLGTDALTTEQLQALAREFNLSETAFPQASAVADYRLRIFTPSTELPFAGHPSVGAAAVLLGRGSIAAGPVVQECGAGLLPLEVGPDEVALTGGAPTDSGPVDPAPLLAAVALADEQLAHGTARHCGTGLPFGYVHVVHLERAVPDMALLEALERAHGLAGVCAFRVEALADDGVRIRARVFAGGAGVPEDPATGSAALGLGVHLQADGMLDPWRTGNQAYVITQGVEIGRPSTLRCRRLDDGRFQVRGGTVPVAAGTITVPPR